MVLQSHGFTRRATHLLKFDVGNKHVQCSTVHVPLELNDWSSHFCSLNQLSLFGNSIWSRFCTFCTWWQNMPRMYMRFLKLSSSSRNARTRADEKIPKDAISASQVCSNCSLDVRPCNRYNNPVLFQKTSVNNLRPGPRWERNRVWYSRLAARDLPPSIHYWSTTFLCYIDITEPLKYGKGLSHINWMRQMERPC